MAVWSRFHSSIILFGYVHYVVTVEQTIFVSATNNKKRRTRRRGLGSVKKGVMKCHWVKTGLANAHTKNVIFFFFLERCRFMSVDKTSCHVEGNTRHT